MNTWKSILDSLDQVGGHILTLMFLVLLGCAMYKFGVPKSEDIIMGSFGALLQSMRGLGNSKP